MGKKFAAKTWKKVALNFLNRLKKKRNWQPSSAKQLLSKFPPMIRCSWLPRPLTSRMVVFIPRVESSNAKLLPNVFFTHGRCQNCRAFHGWHVREGCYGNSLSWYPAANITVIKCFHLIKKLNEDFPYQLLLTLKQHWWSYARKWQGSGFYWDTV